MTVRLVEHHATVPSTNDVALARIRAGCEHGWSVAAERQTAGRGRHGRTWVDLGGSQLFLSIALTTLPRGGSLTTLPLAAGVGVAEAVQRLAGIQADLKWPNDIWFDGRKLGGILCEAAFDGAELVGAVVGIGLNLELPTTPPETFEATAIGAHAEAPDRETAATTVRFEVLRAVEQLRDGATLDAWRARDLLCNHPVTLPDGSVAVARGIDDTGALCAELADGTLTTVVAGDVRIRRITDSLTP